MAKKKSLIPKAQAVAITDPKQEIIALRDKINTAEKPSSEDSERLRNLVATFSGIALANWTAMGCVHQQLIEKITNGASTCFLLAETDRMKVDLGFDQAPTMEKLLIQQIITSWLRMAYAEFGNNQNLGAGTGAMEFWDERLNVAQARFLRSVEALAKVRKLARNTPSLQVNIAQAGGQQVNLAAAG